MSYYRLDWDALNALPAAERMATLARINTDIRRVTGAERARMVHRAVAEHGTQKDAATALGLGTARISQIIKENPMSNVTVTVTPVAPAELHRHYAGQTEPQPCYVEVDLRTRTLGADWNGEIGNAVPVAVFHGFERRYAIPALTSTAANKLLEQIRPLAERMCSDWEEEWDGSNHVAVLGDDAKAAEEEIEQLVGDPSDGWDRVWDPSDCITVWDVDGATNGNEVEEYEITGATTDERLEEIEQQILEDLKGISDSDEVVLEGVDEYLRGERDRLEGESREDLIWSVVRGQSPEAHAVEPGVAGVDVPPAVLSWAQRHGLSENDTDVYLLVTLADEAGDIDGEIAYMSLSASGADVTRVREALGGDADSE